VVRADSRPVNSTGDWVKAIKSSHGHPLAIVVMRDKKEQTLTLTPDSKRRSSLEAPAPEAPSQPPVYVLSARLIAGPFSE